MDIELQNVTLLTHKEMQDARRNRWFILYTFIFAGLSLGLSGLGNYGLSGFGRTTASMINLVLLIVPLMGLTLGAISLAGERERGTLLYIMAQPVNQLEVLLGKYLGVGLSLLGALTLGFGLSGIIIAWHGGYTQVGNYIALVGLTFLLALLSLGLGMFISASLTRADTAVGLSLFVWLAMVFLGDLGVLSTSLVLNFDIQHLFTFALLNPLQVFKLAAILLLQGNLEILGPVGTYAVRTYGEQLMPLFIGILLLWTIISFWATYWIFRRKGGL